MQIDTDMFEKHESRLQEFAEFLSDMLSILVAIDLQRWTSQKHADLNVYIDRRDQCRINDVWDLVIILWQAQWFTLIHLISLPVHGDWKGHRFQTVISRKLIRSVLNCIHFISYIHIFLDPDSICSVLKVLKWNHSVPHNRTDWDDQEFVKERGENQQS